MQNFTIGIERAKNGFIVTTEEHRIDMSRQMRDGGGDIRVFEDENDMIGFVVGRAKSFSENFDKPKDISSETSS